MGYRLFPCLLLWVSLIMVELHGNEGCLEDERMALLEFKASVEWTNVPLLHSWVDDGGISDCCVWERVKCNATTGRVIQLSLHNTRESYYDRWFLNVSLFLPFEELQHLDLSLNYINGWVMNEGFERLSGLKRLELLNLDFNGFNNSILPSLGALTSLKTLSLSENTLGGSLPAHGLKRWSKLRKLQHLDLSNNQLDNNILQFLAELSNLEVLNLSGNDLNGSLPTQGLKRWSKLRKLQHLDLSDNQLDNNILRFLAELRNLKVLILTWNYLNSSLPTQELANLMNLEILDLSRNEFVGSFPLSMGALISLKALSLRNNQLNHSLFAQGLCELKNLRELDLSYNNLSGIIPPCLSNLTSLRQLDLSSSQLRGNISSSLITSFTSLEYISLSHNHFEGTFSFSGFANHSMLKEVVLEYDDNKLEVETEHPSWVPKFQLKTLVLSNCNLNKIPSFLSTQYDLTAVDLSNNIMNGTFPTWLVENNTRLEYLNLRKNSLKGHFLLPPNRYIYISSIDLSDNYFDGELQENIGKILPNSKSLNFSKNALQGDIPSSIGDMRKIATLDLSNNNFSGEIPEHMVVGCSSLQLLKLSNNSLSGQIFPAYFNLSELESLILDNNQFTGNILEGLSKSRNLQVLNIGNNYISGKVPSWIGNFKSLRTLVMRHNFLEGQIPKELSELHQLDCLDISQNNLSRSIPSFLNSTMLRYVHFQGNGFTGPIPESFLNSSYLLTLDIRDNNLSGSIPSSIGVFSDLRILLLKGNHLNGPIPSHLCQMNKIDIMDLSHNTFSGSIPPCLSNITFGRIRAVKNPFWRAFVGSESGYDSHESLLDNAFINYQILSEERDEQEQVEFTTKSRSSFYKGDILNYMSGLDLSCNHLAGDIPHELGELNGIHALNLSGNNLTGSIPKTLSNLTNIESLDLSHNELSGEIPSELARLYTLEVFTVAYNNLSGKTPDMKAQFGTFDITSYEGNAFLCGPPLQKNCTAHVETTQKPTTSSNEGKENMFDIDFVAFSASFVASYIVFLLGFATILYINPYWRRMWFNLIDTCIHTCFDFVSDTIYKLSAHVCN